MCVKGKIFILNVGQWVLELLVKPSKCSVQELGMDETVL